MKRQARPMTSRERADSLWGFPRETERPWTLAELAVVSAAVIAVGFVAILAAIAVAS